ncbi:right-handed parallel beta-helix repeat-containing protein [Paenibacillus aurantiacus]|uniref:Right-handed parallel beta-helix repeat-containing protein n=1 Tax=Paenibacillus aurantiacus TaxID=1936118 RepID=A0ABV5L1A3_9BACL
MAYLIGSHFRAPAQVTAATAQTARSLNILDYLNSDRSIQDAINDVQAAGGGELYFPPGMYFTDDTLVIKGDNVILKGANKTSSIIAVRSFDISKNLLEIRKPGGRIVNVKIEDLTLTSDARKASARNNDTSFYNHGIVLDASHNVEFQNIRVDHFNGDGLRFEDRNAEGGPDQVSITNSTFVACMNGLNTNDTGHSTHIYGGTFEFNAKHGINTGGRNSVFIKDADLEQNHMAGLRISHSSNIVVRDCTFENNSRKVSLSDKKHAHIVVGDTGVAQNIVIDSCYFHARKMRYLISVERGDHISISNNFVDFADQFGTTAGAFVQVGQGCRNIFCDDFSYRQKPNVKRLSNHQYAVSDLKPSAVPSLPVPNESLRGFITRVEGGSGTRDAFYVCIKTEHGSYKWARINLTDL